MSNGFLFLAFFTSCAASFSCTKFALLFIAAVLRAVRKGPQSCTRVTTWPISQRVLLPQTAAQQWNCEMFAWTDQQLGDHELPWDLPPPASAAFCRPDALCGDEGAAKGAQFPFAGSCTRVGHKAGIANASTPFVPQEKSCLSCIACFPFKVLKPSDSMYQESSWSIIPTWLLPSAHSEGLTWPLRLWLLCVCMLNPSMSFYSYCKSILEFSLLSWKTFCTTFQNIVEKPALFIEAS